jgi:hypothetical protein
MWKKSLLLTGVQTMLSLEEQTEHAIQRETDTNIPKTNVKRKFSFLRKHELYSGSNMKNFIKIIVFGTFFVCQNSSKAGFVWLTDWNITTSNQISTNTSNDFVELHAYESYDGNPQKNEKISSYAERQFQLSGFNEPVRITIQTAIDGFSKNDQFGSRIELFNINGIDENLQILQRNMIMPGTSRLTATMTRDVYLSNGIHTISESINSIVSPDYIYYIGTASIKGTATGGIIAINGIHVPEPYSIASLILGFFTIIALKVIFSSKINNND